MMDKLARPDDCQSTGGGRVAPRRQHLPAWARAACLGLPLTLTAMPVFGTVTEYVVPGLPLITFQDDRSIEGHIVRIDQQDIVIQTPDGQSRTLPRSTVDSVAFETVTGEPIVGELLGWSLGIYQIATPEAAIKVYSAMPATPIDEAPARKLAIVPKTAGKNKSTRQDKPHIANLGPADAGQADPHAIAAIAVSPANAAAVDNELTPASEAPPEIEAPDAAATPRGDLSIHVSVEHSKENGPPVAFLIELSKPSADPVVLIYATIDGTATNGKDYEANRGVVLIEPGEQKARIEAAVIDDAEQEEQEHLQLFLTVDPTVAVIENTDIIATIDDDDQP